MTLAAGILAVAVGGGVYWRWASGPEIRPDQHLVVDGVTRTYRLVVPQRLAAPAPVVFAFHGIGDSPETMARYSQLDRLAARHGFLLVYPAARQSIWAGTIVPDASTGDNADLRFFDALLADLPKRLPIDQQRIYLMGMSNGAAFVELLASQRANSIAAVVAHSGGGPPDGAMRENLPPILFVVGQEDAAANAVTADAARQRAAGRSVDILVVSHLGHQWSPAHNAQMWKFLTQHPNSRQEAAQAGR